MSEFLPLEPKAPARAVAILGGACVAVALGIALLLAANARDLQTETRELQTLIATAKRADTSHAAETGLYFDAATPQLAQADLQTSLQELARAHGVAIEVTRTEDVARLDGLVHLNLTLSGTVPEANLGAFLAAIDAARPVILIDEINLRRTRSARGDDARQVAFQLALYGASK